MVPVRGVLSHSCLRKANGDNGMVTGFGCLPGIAGEAIVHQAEERIGAEMFALFGSNHRHSKLHHENSQSFRSGGIFASMFTKGQHRGHGDHWAWRLTGNYCWKSVLNVDALRAKAHSPLVEVWLHGKLLYALMLERRMRRQVGERWGGWIRSAWAHGGASGECSKRR